MTSHSSSANTIPIEALADYPPPGMDAPSGFVFAQDGRFVLYLHAEPGDLIQKLWAFNTETKQRHLIAEPPGGGVQEAALTPEEELRRQRLRQLSVGITSFTYHAHTGQILIPVMGDVYLKDSLDSPLRPLVTTGTAQTPQLTLDGTALAYVEDAELMVLALEEDAVPRRLTHDARGTGRTNGLADYIAQEELHRYLGFWWSPSARHIAFTQVDDTHIPEYMIVHQGKEAPSQESHRYPFAGSENPRVQLGVVSIADEQVVWLDADFGEEVYIARVFWWSAENPGALVLNRLQNKAWLVRFDMQGRRETVLAEVSDYWFNIRHEPLRILSDGSFLWLSERTGFMHLYHYLADGTLCRALTQGDWVVDEIISASIEARRVHFTANRRHATQKHLYAVSLDEGDIAEVASGSGTNTGVIDYKKNIAVIIRHNLAIPPQVELVDLVTHARIHTIHTTQDPRIATFQLEPPQLVTLQNRHGDTLHGAWYAPADGTAPAPVIVHVYGGPGPQMVVDGWQMTSAMQLQYLRQIGFGIFRLDNRGSARRGLHFEGALKHCMGTVEVADQIDGARWLIAQGLADARRIGITGWSYGGYMTLLCMMKAPELFRAGVAGAPVTSWDGYDTAYTERYMNTPQANPNGYHEGSVLAHVANLHGPLLLIHGLLDENVHFRHTARLINALNRARRPYEVLLFPDERHMPRHRQDRITLHARIVEHFQRHL